MALSEKHRQRLDEIVGQMESNGEPEDNIRFVVEDFKKKYEGGLGQRMFPRTAARLDPKREDKKLGVLKTADALGMDIFSGVAGAVSRLPVIGPLLSGVGQVGEAVQRGISPEGREYPLQATVEAAKKGVSKLPIIGELEGPQVALEIAGRSATDPFAYLGMATKSPRIAAAGEKVAQAPGKTARAVGSATTGISKEALSEAATKSGRKALQASAAGAAGSGKRLTDALSSYTGKIPEKAQVEDILSKVSEIDIRPVLEAFDRAKQPTFGPMGARTPGIEKGNAAIEAYKRAIAGELPTPEEIARMDFGGNLEKAKAAIADPESKWGVLHDIAKKADAARIKAENTAIRTQKSASKSASKYGSAPKSIPTPNDPELGGYYGAGSRGMFRGTVPNPELSALLEKSRESAAAARRAYQDVQAKTATGSITAKDAAAAKAELNRAKAELYRADAAVAFSEGKQLDDVSAALVERYGLSGDALENALSQGRSVVAENSFTPNYMMPANEYKRLREALDRDIDFESVEGKALNQALKGPRKTMQQALIDVAGPEYKGVMESWAKKYGLRDEMQELLGELEGARQDIRATGFLKSAAKEGPGGPRYELLKKFDQEAGTNFLDEALRTGRAMELGPEGKAQILPKGDDKRLLSALFGAGGFGAAGPVGAASTSLLTSPAALTRFTIPAADATGRGIRNVGKAAQKIKPADAAKASALLQFLGMEQN